jgi:hypothetical protein
LLASAEEVFGSTAECGTELSESDLKFWHAKIVQQALGIDFLPVCPVASTIRT